MYSVGTWTELSGGQGAAAADGVISRGHLPLGREPPLGAIPRCVRSDSEVTELRPGLLPRSSPPLWSPPSDPGVGKGKQGGCLELGQDGSFNVDPPVPAPVGRGWKAEWRHLLGVGLVQEWGPVRGGQHGAGRLVRRAAEGLSGVSAPSSVSPGPRPCSLHVCRVGAPFHASEFQWGGCAPRKREGETVACSPVDTEVAASVNRGTGCSADEPKGRLDVSSYAGG